MVLTLAFNQYSVATTLDEPDNKLTLISDLIEYKINNSAAILEFTSTLDEMGKPLLLNLYNSALKGIPENADLDRRQIGQGILSRYPELASILIQMPNGTVYLLEPFTRQQNLSASDFSHREYYKGVIATNQTFLGNVITSSSSGRNQAQMAVPIFSSGDDNKDQASLVGVLSAGLNFETFNEILQSLNLSSQERIVLLDSNGTKIADSDKEQTSSLIRANGDPLFKNLQSFKKAVEGETGAIQEVINGAYNWTKYTPVTAIQNNWVLLLFEGSEASSVSADFNSSTTVNSKMNNDTALNSNTTQKSNVFNNTMPDQLPPQSINGSQVPKI